MSTQSELKGIWWALVALDVLVFVAGFGLSLIAVMLDSGKALFGPLMIMIVSIAIGVYLVKERPVEVRWPSRRWWCRRLSLLTGVVAIVLVCCGLAPALDGDAPSFGILFAGYAMGLAATLLTAESRIPTKVPPAEPDPYLQAALKELDGEQWSTSDLLKEIDRVQQRREEREQRERWLRYHEREDRKAVLRARPARQIAHELTPRGPVKWFEYSANGCPQCRRQLCTIPCENEYRG